MLRKTLAAFMAAFMFLGALPVGSAGEADTEPSPFVPGEWPDDISDAEWRAKYHEPDPNLKPVPQNRLIIDALTGLPLEWENVGAKLTEIRVRGVEPEGAGFQLYDPLNRHIFWNTTSTPGGDIVFPFQTMIFGKWVVAKTLSETTEEVVTEFTPPSDVGLIRGVVALIFPGAMPDLYGASYSTGQQRTYYGGGYGGSRCGTYFYDRAYEDKLVPLAILHSPFGGDSEQTTDFANTRARVWGPYGVNSAVTESFTLHSPSGQTQGMFKWAQFHSYTWQDTCTNQRGTTAQITHWYESFAPADLEGASRATDSDDATQIANSVRFDHRYYSRDTLLDGSRTSGAWGAAVQQSEVNTWAGSVTLYANKYVSLSFSAEVTDGATYRYTYNFPAETGSDTWWGDRVRGSGHGWAFCRVGYASC